MKLTKYLCHVLTMKYVLDDGIHMLAYFHKDSVTSCNKKEEIKIDCDKEDCDKKNLCW